MNQPKKKQLTGTIKRNPDGFGFFIPDDKNEADAYISKKDMKGIFNQDKVIIELHSKVSPKGPSASVVKVLKHGLEQVVGIFHTLENGKGIIRDPEGQWGQDLYIPETKTLNAKSAQLVAVKITEYPNEFKPFFGEVIEVLGNPEDPHLDVKRVAYSSNLNIDFPKTVLRESEKIPTTVVEADKKDRIDLTSKNFITIDGKTAKDFDDAIYLESQNKGFKLYVAIADVSHYVKKGSNLDDEAYKRGNSTYFPNYVIPMLPESLSNEICSLKPNVERCAFVAEMDISFQGDINNYKFYEAVIKSHARLTYGEAQEVIDGNTPKEIQFIEDMLFTAKDLAQILMKKRHREGSLDLEIPESQVLVNEAGEPVDIQQYDRLFAHKLIEEFMLITNVAVAKFFKKKDIPALYRIHESPEEDNIQTLNRFLDSMGGYKLSGKGHLQTKISKMLEKFRNTPQEVVLNTLTLRSMKQAQYSADNVGHFGLAFSDYTHFTSPIRRYADLVVHRLVKSQLSKTDTYKEEKESDLASIGTWISACEQKSVKAERLVTSIKKARFMEKHVGENFEGVISSVTKFGVFVLLKRFDIDGLIKLENLGHDYFHFDEESLQLIGKRSGFAYKIGDPLEITVVNCDTELGKIDFELVKLPFEQQGDDNRGPHTERKTNRKNSKKRSKAKSHRRRSGKKRSSKRS